MKYKLLACDLDGTMLDDKSQMPEKNKKAVSMAVEAGMNVVLCSGRSHMSLKYFEDMLGINKKSNYGICYNGCVVYEAHTRKIINSVYLKKETSSILFDELKKFDANIVAYTYDKLYAEKSSDYIEMYRTKSMIPCEITDSFTQIEDDLIKILLIDSKDMLDKVSAYMKSIIPGLCNMFYSSNYLLEFIDQKGNKAVGLNFLADYLGIQQEEVIAVGDNYNDQPMIEWAGLGIAVANAEKDVKDAAGYITETSNNDGALMEIVEKFVL